MRDPAHADKWRYKFMKGMTGPAAGMILLDLGIILFFGAMGHWAPIGNHRHFFATVMFAALAVLVNGVSVAGLVRGFGPDD